MMRNRSGGREPLQADVSAQRLGRREAQPGEAEGQAEGQGHDRSSDEAAWRATHEESIVGLFPVLQRSRPLAW